MRAVAAVLCTILTFFSFSASADSPVLTLTNGAQTRHFTLAELEAMGQRTVETTTIWTEGTQAFTGVELVALLDAAGISEGTLKAYAVNDYAVEVPVSDAVAGGPIIAYANHGAPMSVRDKGPLWLVYPYDAHEEYRSEVIYSRSIWQLNRIERIED